MPGIGKSARWTAQPPGPTRLAPYWRRRGINSIWYANAGGDIVRQVDLTLNGTGYSIGNGKLVCPGATNAANYASLGTLDTPTDASRLTAITIGTPTTLAVRNALFANGCGGTTNTVGFTFGESYTTNTKAFSYNKDGTNRFTGELLASCFAANTRAIYAVTYDSAANSVIAYKGISKGPSRFVGVTSEAGTFNTSIDALYGLGPYCIGGRYCGASTINGWNGSLELQVFGPVLLSPVEIAAIMRDPWGQLLDEPQTYILFPVGADAAASGATVTATASTISGAATADAQAPGATVTATASGIAGGPSAASAAPAASVTATASALAGDAAAASDAAGASVTATVSAIPGTATGTGDGTAAGVTVEATASAIAGVPTAQSEGPGAIVVATASAIPGAATGTGDGAAAGVTVSATASALGGSGAADSAPAGAMITATATAIPGAATGTGDASVAGVTLSAAASFIAGAVTAASQAQGVIVIATASAIAGSANGGVFEIDPRYTVRHRAGVAIAHRKSNTVTNPR